MIDIASIDSLIEDFANLHLTDINEYSVNTFCIMVNEMIENSFHEYVINQENGADYYNNEMNTWFSSNMFSYKVPSINSSQNSKEVKSKTILMAGVAICIAFLLSSHVKAAIISGVLTAGSSYVVNKLNSPDKQKLTKEIIIKDCKKKVHLWFDGLEQSSNEILSAKKL